MTVAGMVRHNKGAKALLSPVVLAVGLLLVIVLSCKNFAPAAQNGGCSNGGAASSGGGGPSRLPAYSGVPEFGIHMSLPTWALCPQPPCQYSTLADGAPNTSVPYNSQFGEDAWLFPKLFHNKVKGFYVEMGAMNGRQFSNTRWLYEAAGWKGLLVEACPDMAAELIRDRKDAIAVHAAMCGKFQTVHWISSNAVGGIYEFMADGFKKQWHKDVNVDSLLEVPCVPFQFLLDKFGIDSIDFWSLDVEGAELEVLKTVDFSRLKVKVLMVETSGYNKEKDAAVIKLLLDAGFQALKKSQDMNDQIKHFNTIFVHASAWPHLAHAPDMQRPEIEPAA